MDRHGIYYRQVQLLLRLIPFIARYDCFALKGGTAINLFVRDLPRLSVDIDLVFLPTMGRSDALDLIRNNLEELASTIARSITSARIVRSFQDRSDALRLLVENEGVQIKVELSPVLRGVVHQPAVVPVCAAVEEEFGFAEMPVVSFADLYAGKICAALDRQHPRDLYDVKLLLENEGLSDELRKTVLVYVISHPRPIAELLRPRYKDFAAVYEGEFRNMTEEDISLAALEAARDQLVKIIGVSLTREERAFLLSFKRQEPDWSLLGLDGIDRLPAVRWKMHNLKRMQQERHAKALMRLEEVLDL